MVLNYMDSKLKQIYGEWIQIADKDYSGAKKMFDDNWTDHQYLICFLCQQATEKYLKGYLAYHEEEIVKTHILQDLIITCSKYSEDFNSLIEISRFLTQFAAQVRYPDTTFDITEIEAKKALEYAETIIEFVKDKMQDV